MSGTAQTIIALLAIAVAIFATMSLMGGRTKATAKATHLEYQPAPVDNPLKGFFPFRGDHGDIFPHSMEWDYFPLSQLMNGPDSFTFDTTFEASLNEIAGRGHHSVIRVYLDYPEQPTGVPQFLIAGGLKLSPYEEHGGGQSPDYTDENLVGALESFIAEFGKRYDGDPRLGFITIGLLGFWGEWHTYPHEKWFPGERIQNRILNAYTKAFTKTKLLLRRPAADGPNLPIGYHDDSFAFSTLPTIDWHFASTLANANVTNRWKTQPIGGELRPELQINIWMRPIPTEPPAEDFTSCVQQTHCSWLICQGIFNQKLPPGDYERAVEAARSLGYEIHISEALIPSVHRGETATIRLKVENRGVAPFYYDWPIRLKIQSESSPDWKLSKLLPDAPADWNHQLKIDLPAGEYPVAIRVANPLNTGQQFRFANKEQQTDGWIQIGNLVVR
jgi:hypothetical protein